MCDLILCLGSQLLHLLAVSDADSGKIYVLDGKGNKVCV